ncbi:MAG: response regulator [Deltaproteobacteria bacterium]|nr:response regulator [Deltaproteobacteria bacterium]
MTEQLKVLIVEDSEDDALLLLRELRRGKHKVLFERVETPASMKAALARERWDIILSDYVLPVFGGLEALKILKKSGQDLPFIIVSGKIGEDVAVGAMKAGAHDYIIKSSLRRLVPAVERELREAEVRRERRRANEELARFHKKLLESEARYRLLYERNPAGVFLDEMDSNRLNARRVDCNHAYARIVGYDSREELLGQDVTPIFYSEEDRKAYLDLLLKKKNLADHELRLRRKDGTPVWVIVSSVIRQDDARTFIDGTFLDITERKRLESQLHQSQKMQEIGQLAGGIAHDLNNILAPIMMSTSILRNKYTDDEDQSVIDMIGENTKRAGDLLNQLLLFARGTGGERQILKAPELISEILKMITETFPKSIRIITRLSQDLWPINGDSIQLEQVLMNLCVNARDAMPDGGILSISVENVPIHEESAGLRRQSAVGPYVAFSVTDTGHGISPEIVDRIFEPFFTTKEIGKGTGLGLSSAYSIVKAHAGFIDMHTEIGKGTEFKVYIPAAKIIEPAKTEQKEEETLTGRGELVLVVDDEPRILQIIRMVLERHGYKVMTAENGAEAIAAYSKCREEIRVLIIDMMMPVMDGEAAIEDLRQRDPHLKIIAVSGLPEPNVGGMAHALLRKPFTREELLKSLHEVLITAA